MADLLSISTTIVPTSAIYHNNHLSAQVRVIDICVKEQAKSYLNAAGGQNLYSFEDFEHHGLSLNFIKPELVAYKQFGDEFIGGLSVIDVLMFNDVPKVKEMLTNYQLVRS